MSSPPIATDVSEVLRRIVLRLQPAHNEITWFRVRYYRHYVLCTLAFTRPPPTGLGTPILSTR